MQKHNQMVSEPKLRQLRSRIRGRARGRDGRAGPPERAPPRNRTKIPFGQGQWCGGVVPAGYGFHMKPQWQSVRQLFFCINMHDF